MMVSTWAPWESLFRSTELLIVPVITAATSLWSTKHILCSIDVRHDFVSVVTS